MRWRRSPAIVAGLLGVAAAGMPTPAFATEGASPLAMLNGFELPSIDLSEINLASMDLSGIDAETAGALGVSFAGGVLVTMGTYALLRSIARKRAAAAQREAEAADESFSADGSQARTAPRAAHAPRHMRPEDWERFGRLSASEKAEEVREDSAPGRAAGAHAAHDYEDIAENYVGKQSFRQRMATREIGRAHV